jgi:hypothetical protein
MTDLEFIESLIQKVEASIVHINTWKDNKQELKVLNEDLLHLYQIKSELEAWEVVKPYVDIIDKYTPYPTWQLKPNYDECKLKETNILIKAKALEVDK